MKNKCKVLHNHVTVVITFKGQDHDLKITTTQLEKIKAEGVEVIRMYKYGGKLIPRGYGTHEGIKIMPLIHKLLGLNAKELGDIMDMRDESLSVPESVKVPVIKIIEPDPPTVRVVKAPIIHEQTEAPDVDPVRGVSWNKKKGAYEAKATHTGTRNRRFLGYYKPENVSAANEAVERFKKDGNEVYDSIMDAYYNLYPERRGYRR